MDKKSIVNDLYQAAVISVLAVGYSMLGKKILKMTPLKCVMARVSTFAYLTCRKFSKWAKHHLD